MKIHHYKIRPGSIGYFTRGPKTQKKTRYRYINQTHFISAWCPIRKAMFRVHPMDCDSVEDAKEVAKSRAMRGFRPDIRSDRIAHVKEQIIGDR